VSNRKPEQILWDRMRGKLASSVLSLHRIENIVEDGMPDVIAQSKPMIGVERKFGRTTFIELKVAPALPSRRTTQLLSDKNGLRLAQRNWLLNWTNYGGRSLVVIGIAGNSDYHICVPGREYDAINGKTVDELVCLGGAFAGDGDIFWNVLRSRL